MMFIKATKTRLTPGATDTIIGEGSHFEGRIVSKLGIRIEGKMTGDIECEGEVAIGENGMVHSNVEARSVVLAGTVHGSVTAAGKLTITSTGRLYGNLSAHSLIVEEGGKFQGASLMEQVDLLPAATSDRTAHTDSGDVTLPGGAALA